MATVEIDGKEYESIVFTGPQATHSLIPDRATVADSQDRYCVGARSGSAAGILAARVANPDSVPLGKCGCGCGAETEIATKNDPANGKRRGRPMRYVKGHEPAGWKLRNR